MHPGLVVACILAGALAAPADSRSGSVETVRLVWHVETEDGRPVDARDADSPINPASVTKVATSLRSEERRGG